MDQAKLETYANWLVQNTAKKGSPEFDTVAKAYKEGRSMVGGSSPAPVAPPKQINYQDATDDPTWIKNARTLYKEVNKADPKDDFEATNFLKDYLYDFNYRLAGSDKVGLRNTFGVASDVGSFSPEGKQAFLDAQQQFEGFDTTLAGVLEAGQRVITDPTTYLGLGGGTVVKQGVKEGIKETAKQGLKRGLVRGVGTGAAEGAVYAGASDLGQQQAQVNAGGQEAIDYGQLATNAGIGAGVGGAVGGVVGGVSGYRAQKNPTVQAAKMLDENPDEALRTAEVARRFADASDARGSQLSKEDASAIINKEYRAPLMKTLNESDYPDKDALMSAVDRFQIIGNDELNSLRNTPQGQRTAEVIMQMKSFKDYGNPVSSDKGWRKAARIGLDIIPTPGVPKIVITKLQEMLRGRQNSADVIADLIQPKNRAALSEVIRMGGQSAGVKARQELLDAGLNMARARKTMRDTQSAQEAAERAKRQQDFEAKRSERMNIKDATTSMRFQERMLKERARVEKEAQRATAKAEADNIATAKRAMGFQWKMEAQKARETSDNISDAKRSQYFQIRMAQQKVKEELEAQKALDSLEKAQVTAKTKEERSFNKALAETNRIIRFRRAMERLKASEASGAPAETISIPQSGMSPGMAPKAPRERKAGPKASDGMSAEDRKQYAREGGPIRDPQRWEGGKATIQEYEQNALEIAKEQPKDLRRVLERAIADMRLATKNQDKREKAYFDAIDAASPLGPEALQVVDDALYFLVRKFQ